MGTFFSFVISFIKQHKVISGIIGASIVIILIVIFSFSGSNNTYTVKKEDLVNTVLVNGTYTIASQTPVISPTNGVITDLFVTNGQQVKKGDKLFYVQSSATQDQIKAAYATYLADSSRLQADNATLYTLQSAMFASWNTYYTLATGSKYQNGDGSPNTTNRVLPEFTTAQDDWLAAEAQYKNQQSVIAKDSAALSSSKQVYDETQSTLVIAPLDGTVINLSAKTQDAVTASTATVTAPSVLVLANFANPVLTASVDQVNIPQLHQGQKASIVFDALPNQTFYGTVDHIDTAGIKTQGTVNFTVTVVAQDVPSSIKPDMTASITIETARKNNVLTIPNDDIIHKNGNDFVELTNKTEKQVTLGLVGLTKTEVVLGLQAGDTIVQQQ